MEEDDFETFQRDFGSTENVVRYIQERSDDIERAEIPQVPTIWWVMPDGERLEIEAGLVLRLSSGRMQVLHPQDAMAVLNDGILTRMRIPIELTRPE